MVSKFALSFTSPVDFEGQVKVERILQLIVLAAVFCGYVGGLYLQRLSVTMIIFAGGVVVSALVCIPSWGCYRQHPIQWQKPVPPQEKEKQKEKQNEKGKEKEKEKEANEIDKKKATNTSSKASKN